MTASYEPSGTGTVNGSSRWKKGMDRSRLSYATTSVSVGCTPTLSLSHRLMYPVPAPKSSMVCPRSRNGAIFAPTSFSLRNMATAYRPSTVLKSERFPRRSGVWSCFGGLLTQRLLEDVPGQHCALDPDRVLDHALQRDEIAELVLFRIDLTGHHPPEIPGQVRGVVDGLPLHRFGEHGGGGLRDGAPLALERDVGDVTVVDFREHRDLVAAQRV